MPHTFPACLWEWDALQLRLCLQPIRDMRSSPLALVTEMKKSTAEPPFPQAAFKLGFFPFYKRKWLPKPMAAACSMLFLLILIHPCQDPLFLIPPHFLSFWKPLAHSFKPHLTSNSVFQLKRQPRFSYCAVVSVGNTWGCCILYFSLYVFWRKKESSLLPSSRQPRSACTWGISLPVLRCLPGADGEGCAGGSWWCCICLFSWDIPELCALLFLRSGWSSGLLVLLSLGSSRITLRVIRHSWQGAHSPKCSSLRIKGGRGHKCPCPWAQIALCVLPPPRASLLTSWGSDPELSSVISI